MTGYLGNPDAGADNAQALVDNAVGVSRMMLPTGESETHCLDCDAPIPQRRREVQRGCKYCVACQEKSHDRMPNVRVVTKML